MDIKSYDELKEAEKSLKAIATKLTRKQKALNSKKKEVEKLEKEVVEIEKQLNDFFAKKEEPRSAWNSQAN